MGLQLNWAGPWNLPLAVEIVFHPRVIDKQLTVEPDRDTFADHDDAKTVPLAKRLVRQHKWILAGSTFAVIPQAAGTFVRTDIKLGLLGAVPNLHLGYAAQINPTVGLGYRLVVNKELKVAVVFLGAQVEPMAIVDEFLAIH